MLEVVGSIPAPPTIDVSPVLPCSQLGPLVSGAENVILVIGGQKIVRDLEAGLRRIREYCSPLEDERARCTYGVPSGVNNILIINRVAAPGRVTAVLVKERLGF